MRILLATMQFGRSYTQGTERYVSTLAAAMRQRGHEVAILAGDPLRLDWPRKLGECVDADLPMYAYPTCGWMSIVGVPPKKLVPFLRQWRPDVVHLNTPAHIGVGIAQAARELGIPLAVTAHDVWWVCPKGTLLRSDGTICDGTPGWIGCTRCIAADHRADGVRQLSRLPTVLMPLMLALYFGKAGLRGMSPADMWRWFYRRSFLKKVLDTADAVICPSRAICDLLSRHPVKDLGAARCCSPAAKWHVVRNGVADTWFTNPRPRSGVVKAPADLTIGFAGALARYKGPHLLLEAAHLLGWTRTCIRIAGTANDPLYLEHLRQLARGLDVEFVGHLAAVGMQAFLRSLDVLALTSVCLENCPYVVLEAQAAGVTVVGPDRGGVAELIDNPSWRYPMGSAQGLADALEHARTHPESLSSPMVPTEEQMADATEAVYQRIGEIRQA